MFTIIADELLPYELQQRIDHLNSLESLFHDLEENNLSLEELRYSSDPDLSWSRYFLKDLEGDEAIEIVQLEDSSDALKQISQEKETIQKQKTTDKEVTITCKRLRY